MKKYFLIAITLLMSLTIISGCTNSNQNKSINETTVNDDNQEVKTDLEFEDYAKEAVLEKLEEMYGDNTDKIEIDNLKIYTEEEMKENELLKEYADNGQFAFEVEYRLLAKENIDKNILTAGNGEIDGNWIINKSNVGILSNTAKGTLYVMEIGTGF